MQPSDLRLGKKLGLGLLCSSAVLFTACGGSSSSTSTSTNPTPTPTPTATAAPTATPTPTPTPSESPDPVDGKVSGPLDPVQDDVVTAVIADTVAPELPDPLSSFAVCAADAINTLVDVPDAAIVLAQSGSTADPAVLAAQVQTSLETFAGQIENMLFALNGDGNCDEDHPQNPFTDDQFAGTPLAPVVAALETLADTLAAQAAAEELDLAALTAAVDLSALATQLDLLGVSNAPVMGSILTTLVDTMGDVQGMLGAIGSFDGATTQAGIETMVSNLLDNVLTGVVPASDIDASNDAAAEAGADPSDVTGQIQTLITTLTGRFGDDLAGVIPAEFTTGIMSTVSPAQSAFTGVFGGADPLSGVLGTIIGNGANDPADLLASLLVIDSADLPVSSLIAALTGDTSDMTPVELLQALAITDPNAVTSMLTDVVNTSNLLGLPLADAVIDVVDDLLGGLLDDLLGGLLGGLI